jgi:hypothetical protein
MDETTGAREATEASDYIAITRLQAAYGDAVTRRAWDELVAMFLPDCPIQLDLRDGTVIDKTGPVEIGRFIADAVERFDFFAFTLLNSVVDVAPDGAAATARLYIQELRRDRETQQWTTAYGLYRDRYTKVAGDWRFSARHYSSLARTTPDGSGMEVFSIPGR